MLHLPLLNALKTFVIAGHYLNFTKAAEDLLVSPSAVSHQVKVLEEYLGFKLFIRQNRTLTLTIDGAHLHASLEGPFDQIARALQDTLQNRGRESLRIALRPFLSSAWLAPRLNSFWGKHSQIEIDLIHNIKMPDFMRDHIDIAIVWGKGDWPGMEAKLLIPGDLTPVCGACLIEQHGRPKSPAELSDHTLIHDEDRSAWDAWLEKSGVGSVNCKANLIIDDTNVRIQSILNGQGIMLGCPTLLRKELDEGVLVQLFETCLDTYGYYLIYPENIQLTPNMETFIDWIFSEAENNFSS
ncbi:LysR substrate-binding domain-containing protein [Amphritea sp. 1_MG-2023]|uniref:LysR substrate-binding domain-containing protein n=1 Tax=Amphritea sp. 1_MG-2023 TaxID=3062670 RepID=UPI0026E434BC|nr:LysR substrate-binding domain-containing protein [Amphritea sp. 1_MG-2023]MDO6564542.1 LysR substrate-binding domain-containing protein [Amphritea sp. 1_MG-2023]